MSRHFDAIIIGTGQAGPSLAARFAAAGMTVAIIERHKFGGTCVNTGCIPTKTLVASAYAALVDARIQQIYFDLGERIGGKNMASLKYTSLKGTSLLSVAAIVLYAMPAMAQNATDICRPTPVIPLTSEEPPARIVIDPPLAEPLASRGVAIIQYCAQNLHLVPVFGPNALAVSPRIGHIHVRVDDASWVWADASGNPIILMGLLPGPHKVLIELEDANHHTLDKGTVTFVVPEKTAAEKHQ